MCSCMCACDIMYGVKIPLQLQCGKWIRQRPGEPSDGFCPGPAEPGWGGGRGKGHRALRRCK